MEGPNDSGFPILCLILAMRAYKPTQLFELMQNMNVMTMLFYGLTGPRGQRPITSGVPDDHMIANHRTKIHGYFFCPEPPVDILSPS